MTTPRNPNTIQRVNVLEQKAAIMARQNAGTLALVLENKAKADTGLRLVNGKLANLTDVVTALTELFDGRIDVLTQAAAAGQGTGVKSFLSVLRDAQVSDDDISNALIIFRQGSDELNLSDAEMFSELFTAFATLQSEVRRHTLQINDLTQVVGGHTTQITEICEQQEEGFTAIREELHAATTTSKTGLLVGGVVGLIAFIITYSHEFYQNKVIVVNGKFIPINEDRFADKWYFAVLVGLALGCVTAAVINWFSKSGTTSSTTSTTSNRRSSFFSRFRGSRSTQQAQPAPVATTAPITAPAPAPAPAIPAPVR